MNLLFSERKKQASVCPLQMAPSYDCVGSSLLCAEDNSVFYDNDFVGLVEESQTPWYLKYDRMCEQPHSFDSGDGLLIQSEECLMLLLEKECQHLPQADYLNRLRSGDLEIGARNEAVAWIEKVRSHFGFGPLCAYLSINYLDRFLSAYELPKGKAWTMQLVAVACLSLAAKVEETELPLTLDLQLSESKFLFEATTIQRMELLVLSTLKWRMHAITPFSFIDYFFCKINNDTYPPKSSISQAIQVIVSTVQGTDFLEFRPSEIAAAVAIYVAGETQKIGTEQSILVLIQLVEKESVLECIRRIHNLSSNIKNQSSASVSSVPQSPIGVLDAVCFSCKTEESMPDSCANSSHSSPDAKRRKLNETCGLEPL